jgi:arylsulfatase
LPHPVDKRYVYRPPMSPLPGQASVSLGGTSVDLTAKITRVAGEQGVLYATGTENSGVSIFEQNDKLVVYYDAFDDHLIVESDVDVPVGVSELGVQVRRTGGKTGTIALTIDGVVSEPAELPLFMTMMSSVGPSVGYDCGSAVSPRYVGPFPFEGALHGIVVQLLSRTSIEAERANAASGMIRQ